MSCVGIIPSTHLFPPESKCGTGEYNRNVASTNRIWHGKRDEFTTEWDGSHPGWFGVAGFCNPENNMRRRVSSSPYGIAYFHFGADMNLRMKMGCRDVRCISEDDAKSS